MGSSYAGMLALTGLSVFSLFSEEGWFARGAKPPLHVRDSRGHLLLLGLHATRNCMDSNPPARPHPCCCIIHCDSCPVDSRHHIQTLNTDRSLLCPWSPSPFLPTANPVHHPLPPALPVPVPVPVVDH